MKKCNYRVLVLILFILFFEGYIHAQVTIGFNTPPVHGALIQLKENDNVDSNSSKGLGFPRVALTQINSLSDVISNPTMDDNQSHIGLALYQTNRGGNFCPGVYVWNGNVWEPVGHSGAIHPDLIMTDGEGNKYTARWFSKNPCDSKELGSYWTIENIYSTQKIGGGAFSNSALHINQSVENKLPYVFPIIINGGGLSENPVDNISFGESVSTISTPNITLSQKAFARKYGVSYYMDQLGEICEDGWHVPTVADWEELIGYYDSSGSLTAGDTNSAGAYLRANNNYYLSALNSNGIYQWGLNDREVELVGFDAVPGGFVTYDMGNQDYAGNFAKGEYWWASDSYRAILLSYDSEALKFEAYGDIAAKNGRLHVRCVKDK